MHDSEALLAVRNFAMLYDEHAVHLHVVVCCIHAMSCAAHRCTDGVNDHSTQPLGPLHSLIQIPQRLHMILRGAPL